MSAETPSAPSAPFTAVVCGIDGSGEAVVAVNQAIALAADDAKIWGVAIWNPGLATMAGIHAQEVAADLSREAGEALVRAEEEAPRLEPILMRASEVSGLLGAAANLQADLIAVGSHGASRVAGIFLGSVATALAHHAPCTVLIAREREPFPGTIVLANDGSPGALDAATVAGGIAAAADAPVVALTVADKAQTDDQGIARANLAVREACGREVIPKTVDGEPHRRIVEAIEEIGPGLVVVGSRGLTGLKALGSVSERVAHRAPCSTLIVRRQVYPEIEEAPDGDG